jgi:hypothetical protein
MAMPPRPRRPDETGFVAAPAPPIPRRLEGASAAAEPEPSSAPEASAAGDTPPPPARRFELDPVAAELISRAITAAITVEMERVRTSLAPPSPSKPPPPRSSTPPPPRSSIRVAAKGAGKLGQWGTMFVGALALVGQGIVWFARPEYAAPIGQALKLIFALAGFGEPAVDP